MRTFLAWLLILSLSIRPALADPTPDDPKMDEEIKNNVTDFRDWMMKELAQFPKPDPSRG